MKLSTGKRKHSNSFSAQSENIPSSHNKLSLTLSTSTSLDLSKRRVMCKDDSTIPKLDINTFGDKSDIICRCEDTLKKTNNDVSVLPNPNEESKPTAYLQDLVESLFGYRPMVKSCTELKGYFAEITEKQVAEYDLTILNAARENNIGLIRELHASGRSMDCCNRFGESLLHLACRRGFTEIGEFLIAEAKLNVRISDDCGRNPFHDICWNPHVQIRLAELVLERDPTLLLIGDKRGHTPFDYARHQDWKLWRTFLLERANLLTPLNDKDVRDIFSEKNDHSDGSPQFG
jgi:hypothetical protein